LNVGDKLIHFPKLKEIFIDEWLLFGEGQPNHF
jgi:hypothetical protein